MLRVTDPFPRTLLLSGVFVFPACLLLYPDLAERIFQLLAASGVACFFLTEQRPGDRNAIGLLSLLTVGFFSVALFSTAGALDEVAVLRRLEKSLYFIAAPFLALLFTRLNIRSGFTLASVKLAVVLVFLVALAQYLLSGERAGGAVNALVFGYLALLLGYFSLVCYPLESAGSRLCSLLAWCAGCGTALLSQSRGAWIAALMLFSVVVLNWANARVLSKRIVWQVCGSFMLLVLVAVSTPFVQQRAALAVEQYHACLQVQHCTSSVGLRLAMWESGLRVAMQRPLLGWGLQNTQQPVAAELEDAVVRQKVLGFNHLHNEYINTLVAQGVIGLFSLLLLLGVPMIVFLKHARDRSLLTESGTGLLLCVGYAFTGLSNLAFGHEIMNAFFIFFMAQTLPAVQTANWMPGVDSEGKAPGDILRAPSQPL